MIIVRHNNNNTTVPAIQPFIIIIDPGGGWLLVVVVLGTPSAPPRQQGGAAMAVGEQGERQLAALPSSYTYICVLRSRNKGAGRRLRPTVRLSRGITRENDTWVKRWKTCYQPIDKLTKLLLLIITNTAIISDKTLLILYYYYLCLLECS